MSGVMSMIAIKSNEDDFFWFFFATLEFIHFLALIQIDTRSELTSLPFS